MKLYVLFFLFASAMVSAEVYTWINEQGVRVYGDEPPAHANKAELPSLQEVNMPKVVQKPKDEEITSVDGFKGYKSLEIISPKEDHYITAGELGSTQIQLHIQPALQPKHEVSILLDGRIIKTAPQLHFTLTELERGSHLIQAHVKYNGKLLVSSPKRRIHIQRPSILNRSRTN